MGLALARMALPLIFLLAPLQLVWAWGNDLKLPSPAPVVDQFGLLGGDQQSQLEQILRAAKSRSGVEISVFIPASLQGREIEDFSISVAEQWKLGRKKEDRALLLVIAPKERKMRLEVGYGLEGEVTDVVSRRLLDDVMRPHFRAGQYLQGIMATLVGIQQRVNLGLGEPEIREFSDSRVRRGGSLSFLQAVFFLLIVILFVVFSVVGRAFGGGRHRYHGGWSGGSGGSSWGGGGGGFGGGGASSSW